MIHHAVMTHGYLFEPHELDPAQPVQVFVLCQACEMLVQSRDRNLCGACGLEVADKLDASLYYLCS